MDTKLLRSPLTFLLVLSVNMFFMQLYAQQRNAVTVSVNVTPPYSVYLSDYISPGSNKLMVTLVFNDYNEPSLDVYLKVKIESNNLRITSRTDFIPSGPINITPGVPVQLSGDQLATYFDLNNVDVAGMSKADLSTGGKLIEGNYTFCFEVYDYKRPLSKPISDACAMANIRLNDPPRLVLPNDQSVISLTSPNINFQWQLPSGDLSATKYLLSLYELPDYKISPAVAVQNNQAVKVFESSQLDNPLFIYDMNSPLLKRGMNYAWRVQAINTNKRDEFKNKGFSVVRSFSYGYPENGTVSLKAPVNGHAFSLREGKTFRWNAPDNLTSNQPYFYRIKVVKVEPQQPDSSAIVQNIPVYTNQSQILNPQNPDFEITVPSKLFENQQRYVWQVTAHTNDQTIASSPVNNCYGPPLIEAFYAGNHTVFVTSTTGANLNDLTGEGEVQITHTGTTQKVYFEHIKVESVGALLVMKKGVVKAKYMGKNFDLKAEYTANGKATYDVDSILIDTDYMRLKGTVKWSFPHATVEPSNPVVYSKSVWITFEDYVLNGIARLRENQVYQLADPYGFTVSFDSTSYFIIRGNNNYAPHLDGKVKLPKSVKSPTGGDVIVPFNASEKIDFINQQSNPESSSIELLEGTSINLYTSSYVIDFSDTQSPAKLMGQPDWKGVYITGSSVEFPVSPDKSNQLFLKNAVQYAIRDTLGAADSCWVTTQGLQLRVSKAAERPDTLWFNTFPGVFDSYGLTIQNSNLTTGYLKGNIAIPLLSEKNRFSFTVPLSSKGFATGYLDQSLDGFVAVFNPDGGEQKIDLLINRAVFADKERLDINVDLSWPLMDITMKSLEGLKIWGNGNIGFQSPNGTAPLSKQMQTRIKGYEVTIDYVGCGRQENLYSIGTSADIVMAEDVTGPDGAPKVNIFSITRNNLLSGNFQSSVLPDIYQNVLVQSGGNSKFGTDQTVGVKQNEATQDIDSIENPVDGDEVNSQATAIISEFGDGGATTIDSTQLLTQSVAAGQDLYDYPEGEVTAANVIELIDKVIPFLKEDQRIKAEAWKAKIAEYDQSEIVTIYRELKDYDKFLKELAKQTLQMLIARLNKPILDQSAKIKTKVVGFIDGKRDELLVAIDKKIVLLIDSIGTKAANAVSSGQGSIVAEIIVSATEGAKRSIPEEINHSVSLSVQKNITDKVIGILDTAITYRITGFIDSTLSRMGYAIIDGGNFQLDKIGNDAKDLLPDIGEDVFKRVTSINIGMTIQNTIVDAFKGINWDEVGVEIGEQVLFALAEKSVVKKVQDAVDKAVANALGENGGETAGAIAGALMKNVQLDFSNIGDKLKNGEIDKIIKFDPSYIKVPTPIAIFEGWVKFTDDDPVWGDSWQATVSAQIRVGFNFTASAQYVNGNVAAQSSTGEKGSTYKYWFLQIGVDDLNIPMTPTPFTLDGANGKVFHHMCRVSNGVYQPNDSVRFGAGLQLFFYDTPSLGSIIAFDIGAEISVLDGGFIFEMYGNAAIGNGNVVARGVDLGKHSLVAATGYLGYNSIESHFVGRFEVTFNTSPVLCAGGEMGVDVKPGHWAVYVGTREKPIFIDLFCTKHPQFKGWFDANNDGLDMGFMAYIHIKAESPWIGISGFKIKPWAEFKLDFGATAIVDFKPFAIEEAHVWLDIYAGIGVKYKTFLGGGNLTIAAINIGGEVLFRTTPKTYFKGNLHGRVVVFNIGVGFGMGVEHEFA
ncbi:MAG: hypothetical protein QM786_08515 [Breznakibacter sp.]